MNQEFPHYFEDFPVGRRFISGTEPVTREEILSFAQRFDPQKHHLDDAFAATTLFQGLSASGWHTAALSMRLLVLTVLGPESGAAGAGVEELRWHRPVRPGDTLHIEAEVTDARVSQSRPNRGVVGFKVTTFNQHNDVVQTSHSSIVANRRPGS